MRRALVVEDRVGRRVAGAVQDAQRAVAQRELVAVGAAARVTVAARAPAAERRRDTAAARGAISSGMPWRAHDAPRRTRRRPPCTRRSRAIHGASRSSAATSAPERRPRMSTSPRWSMCWWVTTISSRSSIAAPERGQRRAPARRARARVGAGVDERQRVVVDQVAVDAPDRERRRDRQAWIPARRRARRARRPGPSRRRSRRGSARAPRRAGAPCPRARRATPGTAAAAARCSTGAR